MFQCFARLHTVFGKPQPITADIAVVKVREIFDGQFAHAIQIFIRHQQLRCLAHRRCIRALLSANDLTDDVDQRFAVTQTQGIGLSDGFPDGEIALGRPLLRPDKYVTQQGYLLYAKKLKSHGFLIKKRGSGGPPSGG